MTKDLGSSPVQDAIARRLRAHMAEHRLTQLDIAARIGIHKGTLNRYLTGEREVPSTLLVLLVKEIGLEPDAIWQAALDALPNHDSPDVRGVG